MFLSHNKVRMHDTDMAGVIFFSQQFRWCHEALEDMVESEGLSFDRVFKHESFIFVIIHCEADYLSPLKVGDQLEVHVEVENISTSSFTVTYNIYKVEGDKASVVGRAKTVHVTLDRNTRAKIAIPQQLLPKLEKHLAEKES